MPVIQDLKTRKYLYVFKFKGKQYLRCGFKTEMEAEEAELNKKIALSPKVRFEINSYELYWSIQKMHLIAESIDMLFPSKAILMRRIYETFSKEKFIPSYIKGFVK